MVEVATTEARDTADVRKINMPYRVMLCLLVINGFILEILPCRYATSNHRAYAQTVPASDPYWVLATPYQASCQVATRMIRCWASES